MIRFYFIRTIFSKIVIGVLCFLFFINRGWAQIPNPNSGKWAFGLGITLNQGSVIDKNFTSLAYSGKGLGIATLINYKKKYFEQELGFAYNTSISTTNYKSRLNESYLNGNYTGMFGLSNPANNGFKLLAGPNLSIIYNARKYDGYINNNNTFEFASSLGAAIELRCGINKLIKGLSLNNRISMPFVSFVEQPAYGSEGFFLNSNDGGTTVKNINGFVGPDKFFHITNTLGMHKSLGKHHKIILTYTADFYKISTPREVKKNNNSLGLIYGYVL